MPKILGAETGDKEPNYLFFYDIPSFKWKDILRFPFLKILLCRVENGLRGDKPSEVSRKRWREGHARGQYEDRIAGMGCQAGRGVSGTAPWGLSGQLEGW